MTLECRDIAISFGGRAVLVGASLTIRSGQTVGLVGSNGAGKSVLLDVIGGFVQPDAGSVLLHGRELPSHLDSSRRARLGLARLFQRGEMPSDILAGELLALAARTKEAEVSHDGTPVVDAAWWSFLARHWWKRPTSSRSAMRGATALGIARGQLASRVDALSDGQQRRLAIANVLCRMPIFALLDEPAASLDEEGRTLAAEEIRRLAKSGTGVLIVEHDLHFLKSVADSVLWLNRGRCIQDLPDALLGSESFRRGEIT